MAEQSPYQIGGALPFAPSPGMDFSGNPASLGAEYTTGYNQAVNFNAANYNNILAGYGNVLGNLGPSFGGITAGYGKLSGDVMNTISGLGTNQQQAINDQYTAMQGRATQDLISRGLGNSTVVQSTQRGIGLDQAKASNDLTQQIAGLKAGYQSQIGLAGLQQQMQAAAQLAAAQQAQLGFMERVSAPYPDAGLYGQLASQYGGFMQANADRAQLNKPKWANPVPGFSSVALPGGGLPRTPNYGGGGGIDLMPSGYGYNPALAAPPPVAAWNPGFVPDQSPFPAAAALGGFGATAGFAASPAYAGGGDAGGGYPTMDLTDLGDLGQSLFDAGF